jgi:hypothetical protein
MAARVKLEDLLQSGWAVKASASEDSRVAARLLLADPDGNARVVDTREGIVYPPSRVSGEVEHWHPVIDVPGDRVSTEVAVFDSDAALAAHLRSLRSPADRNPTVEPTDKVAIKTWTRSENPLLQNDAAPTFALLAKKLRESRSAAHAPTSIRIVVHVTAHSLPTVKKWIHPEPRSRFWRFSKRVLSKGDRIYLVPDSVTLSTCRSLATRPTVSWTSRAPEVKLLNPMVDTYYRSGFADAVCFSGHEDEGALPRDLWTTRANALIIEARSPSSPDLLLGLKPFKNSGAVLLGDQKSNRLWQQFSSTPRFSDLLDCLRGLRRALAKDGVGPSIVQAELEQFMRSVAVADLSDRDRSMLKEMLQADPDLAVLRATI